MCFMHTVGTVVLMNAVSTVVLMNKQRIRKSFLKWAVYDNYYNLNLSIFLSLPF